MTAAFGLVACGSSDGTAADVPATSAGAESSGSSAEASGESDGPTGEGATDGTITCPGDAEVSAIVGVTVKLDPGGGTDGFCGYYGEEGTPGADVSVGVSVEDPAFQTIEGIEMNLSGVERVEGYGDAAWEFVSPSGTLEFGVFVGTEHTSINIMGTSLEPAAARAVYELFE